MKKRKRSKALSSLQTKCGVKASPYSSNQSPGGSLVGGPQAGSHQGGGREGAEAPAGVLVEVERAGEGQLVEGAEAEGSKIHKV